MLKIIEYAVLSAHVYTPQYSSVAGINIAPVRGDLYISDGWARIVDLDPTMHPTKDDFYAQLYVKFERGNAIDAVVAYRGTQTLDNVEIDIETWYKSVTEGNESAINLPGHGYVTKAAMFWRDSIEYLRTTFVEKSWSRLNTTGHSLGGALAALMPALPLYSACAITFNAPGIGGVPGVDHDMSGRIFPIEARYDFISKTGEHLGNKPIMVDVPEEEAFARSAFVHYEFAEHEKHQAVSAFNSFNGIKVLYEALLAKEDFKLSFADFLISVLSQHRISHLVRAILNPKNDAIAYQLV